MFDCSIVILLQKNFSCFIVRNGKLFSNTKPNLTVLFTGTVGINAKEAVLEAAREGIDCRLVSMYSIKPIDKDLLAKSAAKTGAVVTAEEHNIVGGLGGAVCEALSETCPVPVLRVGVEDVYGRSGKVPALLEAYGLTAENIAAKAKAAIALKK